MVITLNQEEYKIEKGLKLNEFIDRLNLTNQKGIAIAINNKVIFKTHWSVTELREYDELLLIKATQGG